MWSAPLPGGVVDIRLLGPVQLAIGDTVIDAGPIQQRAVLAALAVNAGQPVMADTLVDRVWDGEPPAQARAALYSHISRLRRLLAGADAGGQVGHAPADERPAPRPTVRLVRQAAGYQLDIDPQRVDLHRFRHLVAAARGADTDGTARAEFLAEAMRLWSGTPLADLPSQWAARTRAGWLQERLDVAVQWAHAELRWGRGAEVIGPVRTLLADHPLAEPLVEVLLQALAATGRGAEALECYAETRARLADQLGVEPSPPLRALHQALLRGELDRPPAPDPAPPTAPPVAQLPREPTWFTGRTAELEHLLAMMSGPELAPAVVISAIDGMGGIGKTALAVYAAHRMADRYPDGQLFIDLHGFSQTLAPIEPAGALDRLLRTLGVPGERIPVELDDRAALWRSVLAGRRYLIVLDNAATETQVAPLLPGTTGCLVLVTSRRRLGDLVRRLGDQAGWLDELADVSDGARSVTATLEVSYRHLSAHQQRAYRVLGLHPGPEVEPYAVAALAGTSPGAARRLLDQLFEVHLVQEAAPGRHILHDLVRAHAVATAANAEAGPARRAALTRLLDHYRQTAAVAMRVAYPYDDARLPAVPAAGSPTPDLPGAGEAIGWLDVELPNLLAAARHAADDGWAGHAWHLSTLLHRHLRTRGHYREAESLHGHVARAARRTGNRPGELDALIGLGDALRKQGRYQPAAQHLARALELARSSGTRVGEAHALLGLGDTDRLCGRYGEAADRLMQALGLARAVGHRSCELEVLLSIGDIHRMRGDSDLAIDHLERSLRIARDTGNHPCELLARHGLCDIHRKQGRYGAAADHAECGLAIARATGNRSGEVMMLQVFAEIDMLRGWYAHADAHLRRALEISRATGSRVGEAVAHNILGNVHRLQRRYEVAADHLEQGLTIARAIGNAAGELFAMACLGDIRRRQGRYDLAAVHLQRLGDLARENDERNWQYEACQGLGRLHLDTGRPGEAVAQHRQALRLAEDLEQPADQARAHDGLAHAQRALNDPRQARRHWQDALDILTSLGVAHTHEAEVTVPAIRAHLNELGAAPPNLDLGKD